MPMDAYELIDRVPELPYFALALVYAFNTPVEVARHVFAVAFCFLSASVFVGVLLKCTLKTERPVKYHCLPAVKYDIPSLHTQVSVGAVVFVYFVDPRYCLVLAPIGALYMVSRVKLGLHTRSAVYCGALIGLVMGYLAGQLLGRVDFGGYDLLLSAAFFATPLSATAFRLVCLEHPARKEPAVEGEVAQVSD